MRKAFVVGLAILGMAFFLAGCALFLEDDATQVRHLFENLIADLKNNEDLDVLMDRYVYTDPGLNSLQLSQVQFLSALVFSYMKGLDPSNVLNITIMDPNNPPEDVGDWDVYKEHIQAWAKVVLDRMPSETDYIESFKVDGRWYLLVFFKEFF